MIARVTMADGNLPETRRQETSPPCDRSRTLVSILAVIAVSRQRLRRRNRRPTSPACIGRSTHSVRQAAGEGLVPAALPHRHPGQPLPPPTRTAPLSDGSQGRAPTAPQLTPEYLAKWQAMSKSRVAGSSDSDNTHKCLPPGMPAMMNMAYGMEIMQTKDKITFFSELNDALRRVYLDGRKPRRRSSTTRPTPDTPPAAGKATRWSSRPWRCGRRYIEGFTPHSNG